MTDNQTSSRRGRIIILALVIVLIALLAVIAALLLRDREPRGPAVVLEPDYALIEVEKSAEPVDEPDAEKPEVVEGGGSVTINFEDEVTYSLSEGTVRLFSQNPGASTHNMVVQVILQSGGDEYLLAQSGILEPGFGVSSLPARDGVPQLSAGGYSGKLRLLFYDPATGERALVDTDIPCAVRVVE